MLVGHNVRSGCKYFHSTKKQQAHDHSSYFPPKIALPYTDCYIVTVKIQSEFSPTYKRVKSRFQIFWAEKRVLTTTRIDLYASIYGK